MRKEELKKLLDSLEIENIESFEINYKKEKDRYGIYYQENTTQKISYNT